MYIIAIENFRNQNVHTLNTTLMALYGVIVGDLDKPRNKLLFSGHSHQYHPFSEQVRLIDTSCSYTPYISYISVSWVIFFLLKKFVRFVQLLVNIFDPPSVIEYLPISIMKQLKELDTDSLKDLDNLLLNIPDRSSCADCLFISAQ